MVRLCWSVRALVLCKSIRINSGSNKRCEVEAESKNAVCQFYGSVSLGRHSFVGMACRMLIIIAAVIVAAAAAAREREACCKSPSCLWLRQRCTQESDYERNVSFCAAAAVAAISIINERRRRPFRTVAERAAAAA